jgi:hypothetical protein
VVDLQLEMEVDRLLGHKMEVDRLFHKMEVDLQPDVELQHRYLSQYHRLLQSLLQDRHHYHRRHQ